ncbi:calcineurin-binding protein cabin-1-like [Elysia marginata]|uniref:Calcineurin-binding protein cabin-1-like n=1 Tax=Elysia marginata TaxID=1093978 RepID=A0AAV4I5V5_9GAST|nr:calcineurin-binding protein cabin-1-like [Elysia marginata]
MTLTQFCARLYWLEARQHQAMWQTLDAVDCFQMVKIILEDSRDKEGGTGLVIVLPNNGSDGVISLQEVSQMMDSVQRCRSLEDTRNLYDQGEFSKVVENLMATFNEKNKPSKPAASKERPSQLLLLLDSLHNLGRQVEVLQWGEVCLNEAVLHFERAPSLQLRQDWAATLVSLFEMIDRVLDREEGILQSLSHHCLIRLAHNLVAVIQTVLDVAEGVTEMPIASVRPWKILYRVLRYEEESLAKSSRAKPDSSGDARGERMETDQSGEDGDIHPSLAMLIKSHEYLGRHSWCTKEDGLLLTFIMSILGKELSAKDADEDDDDEDASSAFEQCVYCLYNHPNKRGRARHLSDHNAPPVEMSWEGAGPVFHYFAPDTIPEFDSYKTSTISSDVEHLLRKIFTLIPDGLQPGERHTAVVDYIEGTSTTLPTGSNVPVVTSPKTSKLHSDPYKICSLIYYLLGDFYFKNKEPAKAVKFYQLDVAVNSTRLDAWVGLALARMSQLMQKLNSTELKVETPVNKKSEAALRCFRRAVELEDTNRKLWLEFGSLAYQLHSHASRQIHYRNMFNISGEMLMKSHLRRTEMLNLAKNCYCRANECEGDGSEDDWLTHYMMGKVAEKQGQSPKVFLDSYKQAALCLHEEEAVYPAKLQFTTLPPHLALEALEVFFRIQASSLKLALSGCDYACLLVLDSFVSDSHESFFARREQKQSQVAEAVKSDSVPSSSNKTSAAVVSKTSQTSKKPKKTYHKTPVDHDYSRHKSVSDSQSEGEERRDQGQTNLAQAEDMEGSSDWSQEDIFESSKPTTSDMINLGQRPSSIVYEISSSSCNKVAEMSLSNTDQTQALSVKLENQNDPQDKKVVSSASKDNRDLEVPMECGIEEVKDKCVDASKLSSEDKASIMLQDTKGERMEGSEGRESESLTATKNPAMETDTMEEDLLLEQSCDNQATSATDKDMPPKDSQQLEMSCVSDQSQKSAVLKCESFAFSIAINDNKEIGDVSERQETEDTAAHKMVENTERLVELPTNSGLTETLPDECKNVRSDDGSIPFNEKENLSQETGPSSGLTSSKGREKWEIEDQEKATATKTVDTQISNLDPVPQSSLAGQSGESVREEMAAAVSEAEVEKLRSEVKMKCIAGLEVCAMRFSSHYKSLYRLAHAYYVMKDYSKARDLLLGCPDWQQQTHMPAPGLFSERKQNNFFQGLWKIPIEDIDRSGSFASHVHRSVQLLLTILAEQQDLDMLLHIRNQLRRTPDSGKKYLRDSERLVLAQEAYLKCVASAERLMEKSDGWSESRREDNLLTVYRVWSVGKGGNQDAADRMLHAAFKLMMKGRTDVNRLTPGQAILYCNQNLSKLLTPVTPSQGQASQKSVVDRNKQVQSQTPTSLDLEQQDKTKLSLKDSKEEDESGKSERSTNKTSVLNDQGKVDGQPRSEPMSSKLSPHQSCGVRLAPTAAGVVNFQSPTSGVSSDPQQDESVIVISDPE